MAVNKRQAKVAPTDNIIFADKVSGLAVSAAVTKLYLVMEEEGNNPDTPVAALVLPTAAFLDMVEHFYDGLSNNPEMRQGMISALDAFKARLQNTDE